MEKKITEKILILGAGNACHDFIALVEHINEVNPSENFMISGILDDNDELMSGEIASYPVLGKPESVNDPQNYFILNTIGNPNARLEIALRCENLGFNMRSFIHPSAVIPNSALIGNGVIIFAGAILGGKAKIGDHALLSFNCSVGHTCDIGAAVNICPGANIGGHAKIGNKSYIGIGSIVLNNLVVGDGALIGAGAVLMNHARGNMTYAGNPAKPINTYNKSSSRFTNR